MNQTDQLTPQFLLNLYTGKSSSVLNPVLQILAFEISENNPKEIIIRLSDGSTFFDATLLGPYDVRGDKIVVSPFTGYHGNILSFKKWSIIKVLDFFSKLDETKICRLKMVIRKMEEARACDKKINRPEDLAFCAQFNGLVKEAQINQHPDQRTGNEMVEWVLSQKNLGQSEAQIKVLEDDQNNHINRGNEKLSLISKELQILGITKDRNPDEPLTYRDILNKCEGFFVGRLLRMKPTLKESKGTSTHMLALGFLDSKGDMLRVNFLGKMAVKQERQLKLGKCYYIKGLELVQIKGASYIKLKDRDYRLHLLSQPELTSRFPEEYYHWEHEYDYIENEMVDIVGVIEDIEEKTNYGVKEIGDLRQLKEVIRVVIRNKFKTVKVNFWSDQLRNLSKLNLKKGEVVIFEDIRKKKQVFLDFAVESNVIRLSSQNQVSVRFTELLPENLNYAKPINISCIYEIQTMDKYNTKIHTINAHLLRIQEEKIIFKYCDLCKKKININSAKCFECKTNVMSFKYNTNVEFGDYSGSIWVSVYDAVAEKLFGVSALRLKEIREDPEHFSEFEYGLFYQTYQIGIEIKSQRFILRNVENLIDDDLTSWCTDSLKNIHKMSEKAEHSE